MLLLRYYWLLENSWLYSRFSFGNSIRVSSLLWKKFCNSAWSWYFQFFRWAYKKLPFVSFNLNILAIMFAAAYKNILGEHTSWQMHSPTQLFWRAYMMTVGTNNTRPAPNCGKIRSLLPQFGGIWHKHPWLLYGRLSR